MDKKKNWFWIVSIAAALIVGIIAGYFIAAPSSVKVETAKHSSAKGQTATVWTCSMHPQIRQPKPGKCPICFMDLIPLKKSSANNGEKNKPELTLSPRAQEMARVQTETVRRKSVDVNIRLLGKVDFDESLMAYITARMPGRIDKLYVDYTGISVQKGDHMAEYFSPELMVAQQELLIALKDYKEKLKSKSSADKAEAEETLKSVLKKFDAWGLTKENIDKIIKTGKVSEHMILYAPVSGIVIHKNALEGKYFKTGDRLFTIANLSEVWIMLEAYETDLPWLRYGQKVEFSTNSLPGEVFKGRISFIEPTLDSQTRTVKIRVDAPNPAGKLKPEMFVNAVVYANVSQSGKVVAPFLAGKWICPMHPSVIEDKPGKCHICGMKLVKTESLGYSPVDEKGKMSLVIPASAPLITGKRAIVYLALKNKPGTYYGQEVVLGPRAGNYYIVEKGLKEGDQVVVNGNFEIDSALQIEAKPSMMSPEKPSAKKTEKAEKAKETKSEAPQHFKHEMDRIYLTYFDIQNALSEDNLKDAQKASEDFQKVVKRISHDKLKPESMKEWHKLKADALSSAKSVSTAENLTKAREGFSSLSTDVYELCRKFGASGKFPVYRFFCPMAFNNKGGYWLQNKTGVFNPYFGKVMLKCGEKTEDVAK
jgi:Cu(I)/Ag(I) efflux system membrane fusion protein